MSFSDVIGGYFGLEFHKGEEYYPSLVALNTGRNALEYIIKLRGYKHIYLPHYFCDVILEPLQKLQVTYEFYHVNERLELEKDIAMKKGDALLYINYFGVKDAYTQQLSQQYHDKLIIDNTLAFFSSPLKGVDTFYSCRKFFGVPDGAYVSADGSFDEALETDESYERFAHLLKRIDLGAEYGYADFSTNDKALSNQPLKRMSRLTHVLMKQIDYAAVIQQRNENFAYLHQHLGHLNEYKINEPAQINAPMIYPLLISKENLKRQLIQHKIFVASYWPNVVNNTNISAAEQKFVKFLLALPIDQRYTPASMDRIIALLT